MSLEDARKATTEFKSSNYVPPKRTIYGIRQKLGDPRPLDRNCLEVREERRLANQQIMSGSFQYAKRDSIFHVTQHAVAVGQAAERQAQRGRYKDTLALLEKAEKMAAGGGDWAGRDPSMVAMPIFKLFRARINAAMGKDDEAVGLYSAASRDLKNVTLDHSSANAGQSLRYGAPRALAPIADGMIAKLRGDFALAEAYFREAFAKRYLLAISRAPISHNQLRSILAQNLLNQGRIPEAEFEAREAWKQEAVRLEVIGDRALDGDFAQPTMLLAEIYLMQNRLEEARYLARMAVNMHEYDCANPDSIAMAKARGILALTLAADEEWTEVDQLFQAAMESLADNRASFDRLYSGNLEWAVARANLGKASATIADLLPRIEKIRARGKKDDIELAENLGVLALAQHKVGEIQAAERNFAAATSVLLASGRNQQVGSQRRIHEQRMKVVLRAYLRALTENVADKSTTDSDMALAERAFVISNTLNLGYVQRAVSASAARTGISDPALADLVRREQDAEQQIDSVLRVLSTLALADKSQIDFDAENRLRQRFNELTAARAALLKQISQQFPSYADLVNPPPVQLSAVANALGAREALLMYHVDDDATLVWVVRNKGIASFARVAMPAADIEHLVDRLRRALDPNVEKLGDIPSFDVVAAHELYRQLLAPVGSGWQDAKEILLVPDGALERLPFGLLVTRQQNLQPVRDGQPLFANYRSMSWLINDVAIARYPSANALVSLRKAGPAAAGRKPLMAFADPYFNQRQAARADGSAGREMKLASRGASASIHDHVVSRRSRPMTRSMGSAGLAMLPRLPETAAEARGIAAAVGADPDNDVLVGRDANEHAVKTMTLKDRKVLVFATHGLVPGDLNGLAQPALALSAPEVSGVEGDGLLTMSEILGLKLDADWIVLSACNTGAGDGSGAEAVSGLGRAFFYAGSRALLVTNWSVETNSAKALTTKLFEIQAGDPGLSRAEALQGAIRALVDSGHLTDRGGRVLASYAHPIFWAPFTIVGDNRGAAPGS